MRSSPAPGKKDSIGVFGKVRDTALASSNAFGRTTEAIDGSTKAENSATRVVATAMTQGRRRQSVATLVQFWKIDQSGRNPWN